MNHEFSGVLQDASAEGPPARPSTSLTYEPFYGLSEKPFSLSADPRFLFKGPAHAPAFDALLAGIRRREGLIVLTGEIGTGKTTLCRSVLQHLDHRTFAAFVPDPFVSREDLLKMLLVDFGVISVGDLKRGRLNGASRPDLSYPLYEFLDSLVPLQAFAVLIIDEAQNLPLPLLEEIRILSDLERREKLLQVVLVGQPELRSNLKLPQMRQVDQRVSVRCELTPLDAEGVAAYVNYRLGVASDGESRVEFTPASLDAVYRGSSGVPRLVNRICDRALQRAYLSRSLRIDPKVIWDAVDDLGLSTTSGADEWGLGGETVSTPNSQVPISKEPEQPPTRSAAAVTTVAVEVPPVLSQFAVEAELFDTRAASTSQLSTWRRRWIRAAVAAVFAAAGSVSGALWYLRAQAIDGAAVAAVLPAPPARPFLNREITPPVLPDAAASDAVPPAAPAASNAPAERDDYVILVASFESRDRAERLVEELTSAGFRARVVEVDLGPPRGRWVQVVVGGYVSAIEVERDLQRIRELPGYGDARLLER